MAGHTPSRLVNEHVSTGEDFLAKTGKTKVLINLETLTGSKLGISKAPELCATHDCALAEGDVVCVNWSV